MSLIKKFRFALEQVQATVLELGQTQQEQNTTRSIGSLATLWKIAEGPPLDGRDLQQEQHRCLEGGIGVAYQTATPATECQNCDGKNTVGNSK